ncbi:MAG: N-acetyltransferase [Actinomycetota bacterium]|nr:N-acetyltransferase [Actinomycetota bacterium]
MRFTSELLGANHDLGHLDCGNAQLNEWLSESAHHAAAMNTGRTFVWHRGDHRVLAYFTLAAHLVTRADVPSKLGRGSPWFIPSVLLARLALDRTLHGQSLGSELLWDALSRAVAASRQAAARLVVVDAIGEDVASFYRHHGFVPLPEQPLRLVQKLSSIEAALTGR